jgi:hypothetical protein
MRGTVAKRLRKQAYGDRSHKVRKYKWHGEAKWRGPIVECVGDRGHYLGLKARYGKDK